MFSPSESLTELAALEVSSAVSPLTMPTSRQQIPANSIVDTISGVDKSYGRDVLFRMVTTDEQYRAVVALRYAAYLEAGKLGAEATESCMSDKYDRHSTILFGVCDDEIVATTRLTYASENDAFELEEDLAWPSAFPPREVCVEVTRTCISTAHRGRGLFQTSLRQLALHAIWSGRRYIVIAATPHLARVYRRIGFTPMPFGFRHRTLNGLEHQIMLADAPAAMCGVGVDPITWTRLWRPVMAQLLAMDRLEASRYAKTKRVVYESMARALSRVARFSG